jgi:glycerol-3-phosphate dehydrogenase
MSAMAEYDLVIIGGGIHGVGVAQAAVAAGHSCLLLERTALAHGSSSRSSKLIHGGLRYLESAQFSLVRESLHERHLLASLAPELVRIAPFHIPIYRDTRRRPWLIRTGLSLYAVLGGLHRACRFGTIPRRRWDTLDGLKTGGLQAVFRYYDGKTDDAALTRAVMESARQLGAELALPAEFLAAEIGEGGVEVRYRDGGGEHGCRAAAVVNAAGPWVDEALGRISPRMSAYPFDWVQGTHLVLDHPSPPGSFYLEAPQDGRAVFVLPWRGVTMVGTTESVFNGDPERVAPLAAERDYLRQVVAHYFNGLGDSPERAAFAGLRVLPKGDTDPFSRSRDTHLHRSHSRILSLYGGKLTTYRITALKVLRQLRPVLPTRRAVARTDRLPLHPVEEGR